MYHGHEEQGYHERGEDCGCGGHEHHGHHGMNRESHHEGGCGCGGHGHGGMGWGSMPHEGCNCPCHRMGRMGMMGMHGGMGTGMGMGFGFRRFISRDEIISRLEEYLKELQAEAKAVEERIAEIKKRGEGHEQGHG